jgi:hypothetical protein
VLPATEIPPDEPRVTLSTMLPMAAQSAVISFNTVGSQTGGMLTTDVAGVTGASVGNWNNINRNEVEQDAAVTGTMTMKKRLTNPSLHKRYNVECRISAYSKKLQYTTNPKQRIRKTIMKVTNLLTLSGLGLALLTSGIAQAATEVLIDSDTRNGSFELLGGATGNTTDKATNWDTDPDGDVDNWTYWAGASSDSGTDYNSGFGERIAFLQETNQVYNLTGHTIAVGDVIDYSWFLFSNDREIQGGLVYYDGETVSFFSQTDATETSSTAGTISGSYTVTAADTDLIGNELGFGFLANGSYPGVDDVTLQVTAIPEPSSMALIFGTLALVPLLRRCR